MGGRWLGLKIEVVFKEAPKIQNLASFASFLLFLEFSEQDTGNKKKITRKELRNKITRKEQTS